jgi:hypothetical protein
MIRKFEPDKQVHQRLLCKNITIQNNSKAIYQGSVHKTVTLTRLSAALGLAILQTKGGGFEKGKSPA